MKQKIEVIEGVFAMNGKVFTKISANFFGLNDKIVVYHNGQKTKEFQVKYVQKPTTGNAYFEEIKTKETTEELTASQFNEGDEIYFPDPDELFMKIIDHKVTVQ